MDCKNKTGKCFHNKEVDTGLYEFWLSVSSSGILRKKKDIWNKIDDSKDIKNNK